MPFWCAALSPTTKGCTMICDPPRAGCGPAMLRAMAEADVGRIVYVSCDPATLIRDLAMLASLGYTVGALQPVDMFPQTAHVETVCLLVRRNALHINIDVDVEECYKKNADKPLILRSRSMFWSKPG
ncbi:MAG: hypothetical protein GXY52_03970 [Chloroflexi bacterium]|nr:hypothetical protein [Chloroflexota bacterium]